jgi:MoxR-like ATPase
MSEQQPIPQRILNSPQSPDGTPVTAEQAAELVDGYARLKREVGKFIVGQEEVVEQVLIAIFAGGHCLLEGVPGLAKTMLVKTISDALHLSFRRVQFTPDLMPADITGTEIIQEDKETGRRSLVFEKGPIFAQMLLADEINRTPPKTQAALLEAMQEHRVTIGQDSYVLDEPFFVLATQNPIEQEGTYPLPEAQKDRFLFHIRVGYPGREEEREILRRTTGAFQSHVERVLDGEAIRAAQALARQVPVPDHVTDFVLDLVRSTRPNEEGASDFVKQMVDWGAGPRACQHLVSSSKVRALLEGRECVALDDVKALASPVLRHRMVPTFHAEAEGVTLDHIIEELVKAAAGAAPRLAV